MAKKETTYSTSRDKIVKEQVLKEFVPIGKYRIRLLENPKTKAQALDIREYVSSETFEGFTRRGIRLTARADVDLLAEICKEVAERQNFGQKGG